MQKDIQRVFDSITPDNIKDIPVIQDAMEVFMETLKELSAVSIDVQNIYDNPIYLDNLAQMYLDDLYNVLKKFQVNDQIDEAIDRLNDIYGDVGVGEENGVYIKKDVIKNLNEYITEEHFFSFRSYKQNKGTEAAIEYIYDLLSGLVMTTSEKTDFRLEIGDDPFHLRVEGSMPDEIYENLVYPLAHPLGFTYSYDRYIIERLRDYFPKQVVVYDTRKLEVRCLLPDGSTGVNKYIDNTLSESEQIAAGLDPTLEIVDISDSTDGETRLRKVFLSNGQYLRQTSSVTGQTRVWLMEGSGADDDPVIREFEHQCSIYADYTPLYLTSVTDEESMSFSSAPSDDYQRTGSETPVPTWEEDLQALGSGGTETLSETLYQDQNTGNDDYIAREHELGSHLVNLGRLSDDPGEFAEGDILKEPVYAWTSDFVDYNGVSHGPEYPYLFTIGDQVATIGGSRTKEIGPYYIGEGFLDEKFGIYTNPNYDIHSYSTQVNAEVVNIQYNGFDVLVDQSVKEILEELDPYLDPLGVQEEIANGQEDFGDAEDPLELADVLTNDQTEHQELDAADPFGSYIMDSPENTIGDDKWVGYKVVSVSTDGDSYVELHEFFQDSDRAFNFGVYRDGARLEDNNQSAV